MKHLLFYLRHTQSKQDKIAGDSNYKVQWQKLTFSIFRWASF